MVCLQGKKVFLYLKKPEKFRLSGLVLEESEHFIVLQNDRIDRKHHIAKDNIAHMEELP